VKIDLHIHSKYSHDGVLEPEEIVRLARQRGLGGVAITDHNTIRGGEETKRFESSDFQVIIGAEIMTDKGEVTGLFLSREIDSRRLDEVVAEIRAQGGMVIVPHPFDELRRSAFRMTDQYASLVDAVEGFNARCILERYNRRAVEFAARHHLPVVGGSDAHYANEIGNGGIVIESDDIRAAIAANRLELFGQRSPIMCHVRTKIRKLRGKAAR
jgi:predicted metal-dependent phosphoesterase TrpH